MSAAGKARGTLYERQVADYLQSQGINAKRLPRTGVKDIGDLAFTFDVERITASGGNRFELSEHKITLVAELKNRKTMALPEWIGESELEATHYQEKYPADGDTVPIVIHKRRGKGPHQSYVTLSLDTLVDLLRLAGHV